LAGFSAPKKVSACLRVITLILAGSHSNESFSPFKSKISMSSTSLVRLSSNQSTCPKRPRKAVFVQGKEKLHNNSKQAQKGFWCDRAEKECKLPAKNVVVLQM